MTNHALEVVVIDPSCVDCLIINAVKRKDLFADCLLKLLFIYNLPGLVSFLFASIRLESDGDMDIVLELSSLLHWQESLA